jgi:hypothetical protein
VQNIISEDRSWFATGTGEVRDSLQRGYALLLSAPLCCMYRRDASSLHILNILPKRLMGSKKFFPFVKVLFSLTDVSRIGNE